MPVEKMTWIWIATANLIHPNTAPSFTVSQGQIEQEVDRLSPGLSYDRRLIHTHLVSCVDRDRNPQNPKVGGSANRYLFCSATDGTTPSRGGQYRLYKTTDAPHDGREKTGPTRPDLTKIPVAYHHLAHWYDNHYK